MPIADAPEQQHRDDSGRGGWQDGVAAGGCGRLCRLYLDADLQRPGVAALVSCWRCFQLHVSGT